MKISVYYQFHHINKLRQDPDDHFFKCQKGFDKIQHLIIQDTKDISQHPIANINLKWSGFKEIPPKSGTKQGF